jgi:hypothetical protein
MPVILRPGAGFDQWLAVDGAGAAAMQVPLRDALIREVAGEEHAAPQPSLF